MKTAEQWITENSSSGSLDGIVGLPQECLDFVRAIQVDAMKDIYLGGFQNSVKKLINDSKECWKGQQDPSGLSVMETSEHDRAPTAYAVQILRRELVVKGIEPKFVYMGDFEINQLFDQNHLGLSAGCTPDTEERFAGMRLFRVHAPYHLAVY